VNGLASGIPRKERCFDEFADRVSAWCDKVAALEVDALVDAELIPKGEFERASSIVAEELFVRLCLRDYPPLPE
jgi:hypothetical protein